MICGAIEAFCRRFPQHERSYTVKTRRGFHVYFRTDHGVLSQRAPGCDIKGERSYVVAPPSRLGDTRYEVVCADKPVELDGAQVESIINHLQLAGSGQREPQLDLATGGDIDVLAMYRRLADEVGRNNALYRCACVARERGMSEAETMDALALAHVGQLKRDGTRAESPGSRWTEAQRTIKSAFARSGAVSAADGGLPNSVRERLLQRQGSTVLARLLEVFRLMGWRPGRWFEMSEAVVAAGRCGLRRRSVWEALCGKLSVLDGRHIIKRRYVEYLDIGGRNWKKRGRPVEKVFQVPSASELVSRLKVAWTRSDRIAAEDLKSARGYRLALHREYVKRQQPEAPMAWMARRLGVDARTIRRYNRELKVHVSEKVGAFALERQHLRLLPRMTRGEGRRSTAGFWLELKEGRRLPAWRHLGAKLLKEGARDVRVCMRRASRYSLNGEAPATCYEEMSVDAFARGLALRGYGQRDLDLAGRARRVWESLGEKVSRLRGLRLPLFFESVRRHIADDKVAETIAGYVYARDKGGEEVRRPARRGVAYRMLKEFGEGNVYLALLESGGERVMAMARRWLEDAEPGMALDLALEGVE